MVSHPLLLSCLWQAERGNAIHGEGWPGACADSLDEALVMARVMSVARLGRVMI